MTAPVFIWFTHKYSGKTAKDVWQYLLVPQILTHKINLNPAGMHAPPCHHNLTAEAFWGKAVVADARRGAGKITFQADRVGGRGHISDSGNAAFHVGNDLIHSRYNDNV